MRRAVSLLVAALFVPGLLGVMPAGATHCDPANIAACTTPTTLFVVEGVGNVCSKAGVKNPTLYGTKCTYSSSDALWNASRSASSWNQPGYSDGSKFQGLFWPGVGPPAVGPFRLNISSSVNPPFNTCVDTIAGPGCKYDTEGKLTPADQDGTGLSGLGAYCGSSKGKGEFKFTSANNALIDESSSAWDQSAATILPVYGTITKRNGVSLPSSRRPSVRAFLSSRGIGGSGNCGVDAPTTGFQVEGFFVTF